VRYITRPLDLHEDPRLQRAGGCALNVLTAIAVLAAKRRGADGHLAPLWCRVDVIGRVACEENPQDVADAIGALLATEALAGSWERGLTIAPDLWVQFVGERMRHRLKREAALDEQAQAETARSLQLRPGVTSGRDARVAQPSLAYPTLDKGAGGADLGGGPAPACGRCADGAVKNGDGRIVSTCTCARGLERKGVLQAIQRGEREGGQRRAQDIGLGFRRRGGVLARDLEAGAVQAILPGVLGRRPPEAPATAVG